MDSQLEVESDAQADATLTGETGDARESIENDGGNPDVGLSDGALDMDAQTPDVTADVGVSAADGATARDGGEGAEVDAAGNPADAKDAANLSDATAAADRDAPEGSELDGSQNARSDAPDGDSALATESGSDCGSLTPTECLIRDRFGTVCLSCARDQCMTDGGMSCESLLGQTADSGPAVGQTRKDLCVAALSCIFATRCDLAGIELAACYCGAESKPICRSEGPASNAAKECLIPEQNALETTDSNVALDHFTDTSLGGGMANALFLCMDNNCGACP